MGRKMRFVFFVWLMVPLILAPSALKAELLLILAPDEFVDELQPLKTFKDATARPTIPGSTIKKIMNLVGPDEQV